MTTAAIARDIKNRDRVEYEREGVILRGEVRSTDTEGLLVMEQNGFGGATQRRIPWTQRRLRKIFTAPAEVEPEPQRDPEARPTAAPQLLEVACQDIIPFSLQARQEFDRDALLELAESIRARGVQQPIGIRRNTTGQGREPYELVYGERRLRACQMEGIQTIPAFYFGEISDLEAYERHLDENEKRRGLNAMERAEAFVKLSELGKSQGEIAARFDVRQPAISKALGLTKLPEAVKTLIREGKISGSHGERLVRFAGFPQVVEEIAKVAVARQSPVRDLEGGLPFAELLRSQQLVREVGWQTKFDRKVCRKCEFGAFVPSTYGNDCGWCLMPKEYAKKQKAANKAEAEKLAAEKAKAKKKGEPELVKLSSIPYGSYEEIDRKYNKIAACSRAECPCFSEGLDYSGTRVNICRDPKRFGKRKAAAEEARRLAAAEEMTRLYDLMQAQLRDRAEISSRDLALPLAVLLASVDTVDHRGARLRNLALLAGVDIDLTAAVKGTAGLEILAQRPPLELARLLLFAVAESEGHSRIHYQHVAVGTRWYTGVDVPPEPASEPEPRPAPQWVQCARCLDHLPEDHALEVSDLVYSLPDRQRLVVLEAGPAVTPQGAVYCAGCAKDLRACRECGCTDEAGCSEGCSWVGDEDLCSACEGAAAERISQL